MSDTTVSAEKIAIAREFGLVNVEAAGRACRAAMLPFWAACALLQKESMGYNVYGHDAGGVFSNDEHDRVTAQNFLLFLVRVMNGATSNGVGPCQVTWAGKLVDGHRDGGFFRQMIERGLIPWMPEHNMRFGFGLLAGVHEAGGTWEEAGTAYNGSPDYGADFVEKCNEWRERLGMKGTVQ